MLSVVYSHCNALTCPAYSSVYMLYIYFASLQQSRVHSALRTHQCAMNTCKYALHKHAQQTIERIWWKNRGVALLCALLSPHSRQHPPSHQCLDFHTLWVISHTHNMQVSTPLLEVSHTDKMCQHSMGHQVETCLHNHPPIWSFAN